MSDKKIKQYYTRIIKEALKEFEKRKKTTKIVKGNGKV